MEKPKPDARQSLAGIRDKKFTNNSHEEIKKLIEDGDEMQLKETIKTKKDNNKNDNKIKFNVFE